MAAYHGVTGRAPLDEFLQQERKVLVVCGKLLEGFDRATISAVGILRNIQPSSRVLFAQFVGRAVRRLPNEQPGAITAVVVSHRSFAQRTNFEAMDELAEYDPDDDD